MFQIGRNESGTTLIELSVVAVMIGILAAMAVPRWLNYIPQMRAKAAVKTAVSTLREARSLAIAEKISYGVYFDSQQGEYVLFANTDAPTAATYSLSDSLVTTEPVGTDVSVGYATFSDNCVVFDPNGAASESGTVTFSATQGNTIYTVDVLAATGRVRMIEGTG